MTLLEFSDLFDILLNSYSNQATFGEDASKIDINLNEYEKSLFLTLSLEEIIKEYYNSTEHQFEGDEDARRSLNALVKHHTCSINDKITITDSFIHTTYDLPINCWFIVYEQASYNSDSNCLNKQIADVVPTTHDEYLRTIRNPFRGANIRRVLRLDNGDNSVELISKYPINNYDIRYIEKPYPIILTNLEELSIQGETIPKECSLHSALHQIILNRAIKLALQSKTIHK